MSPCLARPNVSIQFSVKDIEIDEGLLPCADDVERVCVRATRATVRAIDATRRGRGQRPRGLAFLLLSALCDTLPSSTECGGSGLLCPSHMYLHPYVHTHDVDKSCTRIIPCSSDARVEVEDKSTLRLKLFSLDNAYDRGLTFSSLVVGRSGKITWALLSLQSADR